MFVHLAGTRLNARAKQAVLGTAGKVLIQCHVYSAHTIVVVVLGCATAQFTQAILNYSTRAELFTGVQVEFHST